MIIDRIKAKKLKNTRDLGGLPTSDGKRIASGKLLRSGRLYKLPEKTLDVLDGYKITNVIDLRVKFERDAHPDTVIGESLNHWWTVLTTPTSEPVSEGSTLKTMKREGIRLRDDYGSDFDKYMIDTYRSIVFEKSPQESIGKIFRLLLEEEGCVLWHCNSGKDRTGIVCMLLESLLGVDEEVIYEDYLASKKFLERKFFWNRIGMFFVPMSLTTKRIIVGYMNLKRVYLQTVVEEIKQKFGSVVEYCKRTFGLTDGDISALKQKYLV
ncbi:MAG: tyrosine-protein phosphatase [Clostridia bacterium]|nr:tyrosine-protein phosphatase [Clostridia bacterium]